MTNAGTLFVLVGAEGCAEAEGLPWARPATEDEEHAFRKGLDVLGLGREELRSLYMDRTGRPYFLMAVLESAPEAVRIKASMCKRVSRLTE